MTTTQRLDRLERAILAVAERVLTEHNADVAAIRESVAKQQSTPSKSKE